MSWLLLFTVFEFTLLFVAVFLTMFGFGVGQK